MDYIFKTEEVALRKLEDTKSDCELVLKWRSSPEIKQDYGSFPNGIYNFESVRQKNIKKLNTEGSFACIMEFKNQPIGYLQFYYVDFEEYKIPKEKFKDFISENDKVMAIDLYIGEVNLQGKGIGTKIIKLLIKTLFEKYNADAILIDPKTINERAIKCYHKAGFKDLFVMPKREKQTGIYYDNLIMGIRKGE